MSERDDERLYCVAACNALEQEAEEALARSPGLATGSVYVAAARGDARALVALLDRDPELADEPLSGVGFTPLALVTLARLAFEGGGGEERILRAAELLLARGADPNVLAIGSTVDRDTWRSPLGNAAGDLKSAALCRTLLEAGADPNDGIALFRAAEAEAWDCLDAMLAAGGDLNDVSNRRGSTPLHHVLDLAYSPTRVKELLARGADCNAVEGPPNELGETPLHAAVRRRRLEPLETLVAAGAELEAATCGGVTPWRHAVRRGFPEIAGWLAKHGAKTKLLPQDELAAQLLFDDVDGARRTLRKAPELARDVPLDEARLITDLAGRDLKDAVALLLDAGWDPLARGLDGGTSLHQTAWFGAPATAELLIERGAPLDVVCGVHDGTPLAWVAHGSRFSGGADGNPAYARIAELLCAAGATLAWSGDPARDPGGRRLLAASSPAVAEVLRRHGAG